MKNCTLGKLSIIFILGLIFITQLGSPFVASAETNNSAFSLVVLPDTQLYSQDFPEIFNAQTQWIVENKDIQDIAFVSHVGDLVEVRSSIAQWVNASYSMSLLEDPVTTGREFGIPYTIVAGNHDDFPDIDLFNQYFGVMRFQDRSYYKGSYPIGDNQNNYSFFSNGGLDFIVIGLDSFDPAPGNIEWAESILKANNQRRAIIVSHAIIDATGNFTEFGRQLYDNLKDNSNLFLMLCGHVGNSESRRSDVYLGNTVYTLLADYQTRDPLFHGGDGWLRLLNFQPELNTIQVRTYSPYLDQWQTDSNSQFDLSYNLSDDPPSVESIKRLNSNPTVLSTVNFIISFSSPVFGVDVTDFSLYTSEDIYDASITSISGSGSEYSVTVSTGTGNGFLRLDLLDDDSILNSINVPLGGSGNDNGSYFLGESYTVDKTSPTPTYSSDPTTLVFFPSADTMIKEASPTSNFGTNTTLTVDSSPVHQILMKFNVSGISGQTVASAKLRLFVTAGSNATGGIFYQTADTSWIESGPGAVTWISAPAPNPSPFFTLGPVANNSWYEIDLAPLITTNGQYSFRIISNNTDGANYNSRESLSNQPELIINLNGIGSLPSNTPTLTPSTTQSSTPSIMPTLTPTIQSSLTSTPTYTPTSTSTLTTTPVSSFTPSPTYTSTSVPTPTIQNNPTTLVFFPSADTMIKEASPTSNFGTNTTLTVDSSPVHQILMKFNVSGISGQTVASAKLRLFVTAGSNATGGIFYQTADTSWIESGPGAVTWISAPAPNPSPFFTLGPVANNSWYEIDLAPLITTNGQYSFRIISNNTDGANYNSRESLSNQPELIINLNGIGSLPSNTPTLTPSTTQSSTPSIMPTLTPTIQSSLTSTPTYTPTSTSTLTTTPVSSFTPSPTYTSTSVPTPTIQNNPTTLVFFPSADTMIKEASPTSNFGTNTTLTVDSSPVHQILMKFNVSGISGQTVASAKLRLFVTAGSNATGGIFYQTADTSWIESGPGAVTWISAPAPNPSPFFTLGPVANNSWYEIDLAPLITTNGQYSFRIISNNTDGANYNSRESLSNQPELIIGLQ